MARIKSKFLPTYKTDWTSNTSIVISHNLDGEDILVQIVNKNNSQMILVDSVEFTDVNTITLTATESPSGAGWRVLLLKV